jgi:hypothetical protein
MQRSTAPPSYIQWRPHSPGQLGLLISEMYNNRRSYTTTHDIDHFEPEMELVIAFKKFKK